MNSSPKEKLEYPDWFEQLGAWTGDGMCVTRLSQSAFEISGQKGIYILRLAKDKANLEVLRKEAHLQKALRQRVSLLLPDTQVVDNLHGVPSFAIHRKIPGDPLTSETMADLSPPCLARLVYDLAKFFVDTHSVLLEEACGWLDISFTGRNTTVEISTRYGKPTWFDPQQVILIRSGLAQILDAQERAIFEDTVQRFAQLDTNPDDLVFGHGDMHGYNMAIIEDELGIKLLGVFDLECAGIFDICQDFFRLELISKDLLDAVLLKYNGLSDRIPPPNRERIAIYFRAFLFYLMVEVSEEALEHLRNLLRLT